MKISCYDIIKTPVVTEKSTMLSSFSKVIFVVDPKATKPLIKKAVEKIFSIEVKKINIVNLPAKAVRFKGKPGKRPGKTKAIVTYKSDREVDFVGGV